MDINYLFQRQQIERSRAKAAASKVARRIHEQLAGEYEKQIEQVTDGRVTFVRPSGRDPR
jgi:Glu-tRNA(Gln) amidotransferase subunit E-like FAD-binding protein